MRAVASLLALAQAAVAVVHALNNPTPPEHAITFEAWNATVLSQQNMMMALEATKTGNCVTDKLNVLVRMSTCFTQDELATIDNWVHDKLMPESDFYAGGNQFKLNYVGNLVAKTDASSCPSADGSVEADWQSVHKYMGTGPVTDPILVITLAKGDVEVLGLLPSQISSTKLKVDIRVSATAVPSGGETVVKTLTDLPDNAPSVVSGVRSVPCLDVPGAMPTLYPGTDDQATCVCLCPEGYAVSGGTCTPKANGSNGVCYWDGTGNGYTCRWSTRTDTPLKLVTDCGASVLIPKDNYVADGRVNKHDTDSVLANPMVKVVVDDGTTSTPLKMTWKAFTANPQISLDDNVKFEEFGVYKIKMVASDYAHEAECGGCVAVIDDVGPSNTCTTASGATVPITAATLADAVALEMGFNAFSDSANVANNHGSNLLAPVKSQTLKDFFADSGNGIPLPDGQQCFSDGIIKELLENNQAKGSTVTDVSDTAMSTMTCRRCCDLDAKLQEEYTEYSCDDSLMPFPVKIRDGSVCSFTHCVSVGAETLVTAEATIKSTANDKSVQVLGNLNPAETLQGTSTLHRTSTCTTLPGSDESCWVTATLSDLFEVRSNWAASIPGSALPPSFEDKAPEYVVWRYKVGSSNWAKWSSTATATFKSTNTDIKLEAWTKCGLVASLTFSMVLHLHSEITTCASFSHMWQNLPTNTLTSASGFCAYPGSDFAALQFVFPGALEHAETPSTVKATFRGVTCALKVADATTSFESVTAAPLTVPTGTNPIVKNFGVELVNARGTDEETNAKVTCTFSFTPYDAPDSTKTIDCNYPFSVVDCTDPEIDASAGVCQGDTCKATGPSSPNGPFESCLGDVFTTYDGATTVTKTTTGCCASCGAENNLVCHELLPAEVPSNAQIGRCEPVPIQALLLGETAETPQSDSTVSTSTALLGASAMVAVVALVVVKRRAAAVAAHAKVGDAYYPLLE